MEKKYISESRYKKSSRKKRRDIKAVKVKSKVVNSAEQLTSSKIKPKVVKKKIKKNKKQSKLSNIITCIILLILIAVISRAILKEDNEPFINIPLFETSNEQVINVGVISEGSLLDENTSNIVLNELNKYSHDMLLEINEDYSITYKIISNVNKVSNTEYILTKAEDIEISLGDIKNSLDNYHLNKDSAYYNKLQNVKEIIVLDNSTLNVKLKNEDPYFIYKLDICLNSSEQSNYLRDITSTKDKLILNRNKKADKELPLKVIVTRYKDMYDAVEAYKENKIDIFVTNSENVKTILGKYEYNIKTYRNGQSLFLFGNPSSEIYSLNEVRQAIAYGINRDDIIESILKSKGDKIDLPYIYDDDRYKYDVYAAENLLLTNGYEKVNKVYTKTETHKEIVLELNLLVNKEDEIKVNIANKIKNNLSAIGIKVNVEKLKSSKIESKIKKGDYDLVLANVNLDNTPDIAFVRNNLFITDSVLQLLDAVKTSEIKNLSTNINLLRDSMSQDISCIGIYSDVSYLIYNKNVLGIKDVNYMNIFKNILTKVAL